MLRAELLYRDPVVLALPRDHPLAGKVVSLSALARERFVLCQRAATPTLYDSILALCSSAGFSPQIVNTSSTWSGVLTLVESEEGIAMVPSGARHLRTPGVVFCNLTPQTTPVGISIAWNPEYEGPIQQSFLQLVRANKDRIKRTGGI